MSKPIFLDADGIPCTASEQSALASIPADKLFRQCLESGVSHIQPQKNACFALKKLAIITLSQRIKAIVAERLYEASVNLAYSLVGK
jgi:hypothetical protein